jgi:hypothetical protein
MSAPVPARTFVAWLRARTDEELTRLLRVRPDLALPVPHDFAALASRAHVRSSLVRTFDGLDAFALATLDAVAVAPPKTSTAQLAAMMDDPPAAALKSALTTLTDRALVWEQARGAGLLIAPGVLDALGPYPSGLGRPADELFVMVPEFALSSVLHAAALPFFPQPEAGEALAEKLADPAWLAARIATLEPATRVILERLADGPPVGRLAGAYPAARRAGAQPNDEPLSPAHELVQLALLVPIDSSTVELPREVGRFIRAQAPRSSVGVLAPDIPVGPPGARIDSLATTEVGDWLRLVEALCTELSLRPAVPLRSGGIGVRDVRRLVKVLGVPDPIAILGLEVAQSAGLIGSTDTVDPLWLPTVEFDRWRLRETSQRWVHLAATWLSMTRHPVLVGQRDEQDRPVNALSGGADRSGAPVIRRQALGLLAALPVDCAVPDTEAVLDRLAWMSPRRAAGQRVVAAAALAESAVIGMTAAGSLTSFGRSVLADALDTAAAELFAALPTPVDHFLLQPDLTAVVPGPPSFDLAAGLRDLADLESTGGASVYRISDQSIRRALDAGRTGAELSAFFARHSRTPVPQSLTYLIDDISRRHGVLRAGVATTYLRCDDEALLTRAMSDRSVAALALRRLAPTVVISDLQISRVLEVLRDAGYTPMGESADGVLVLAEPSPVRAKGVPPRSTSAHSSRLVSEDNLRTVIERIRVGDKTTRSTGTVTVSQAVPGVTSASTLGVLREAIRASATIWVGYVDASGLSREMLLEPISLGGGFLRGHDPQTRQMQAVPLHRLTAVSITDAIDPSPTSEADAPARLGNRSS